MNPLAYFALELHHQREQEAERAIRLRRQRLGDDEAPVAARDRLWAAAIRRFATGEPEARATDAQPESRPEPREPRAESRPTAQAQPST